MPGQYCAGLNTHTYGEITYQNLLKSGIKKNVGSRGFRVAVALAFSAAALVYAAFRAAL